MVYLLAEFDPIMSELLNDEKNKNKYLQNPNFDRRDTTEQYGVYYFDQT